MRTSYSNLKIQNSSLICSICKKNDKFVTDPECGELICSNCGQVISDSIEAANRQEGNDFTTQ
jgi:transcription initiation factor TFIIIB Brf1 subunit/transcription initiation factor TFIIB